MISAQEALERLREGNRRFVSRVRGNKGVDSRRQCVQLVAQQQPFATVLGCSDARVPAEILFDQGLGDLFVIRVAGTIAAPSQVGSIEYAASKLETPLVVVLGHSQCGGVQATIEEIKCPAENQSPNLLAIIDHIRPSVESLLESELRDDFDALVQQAVRANVNSSVNTLRQDSAILRQLVKNEKLTVVGAEYSLETGTVDFFDRLEAV